MYTNIQVQKDEKGIFIELKNIGTFRPLNRSNIGEHDVVYAHEGFYCMYVKAKHQPEETWALD